MQLALVEMQRRVQGRVPLPRIALEPAWVAAQQAAGRPARPFQRHPARVERLPPDAPPDRGHPACVSRRSNAPTTTPSSRCGRDGNALGTARDRVVRRVVGRRAWRAEPRTPDASTRRRAWTRCWCWRCGLFLARVRRGAGAAGRSVELEPRALPDLRLGADFAVITPERRPPAVLRALRRRNGRSRR